MSCTCGRIGSTDSGACFSDDRLYRYALWRMWIDERAMNGEKDRFLFVIGLNPSTADEHLMDATMRRVKAFAMREGCNGFVMANAFGFRSTNAAKLRAIDTYEGIIGDDNDEHLRLLLGIMPVPIIAWGANLAHKKLAWRQAQLRAILGDTVRCFGVNADGTPEHPLYLPSDRAIVPYTWPA